MHALNSRTRRQLQLREHRALSQRRTALRQLKVEKLEDRALLAFDVAINYPVGANPQGVVSGDFNNDGRDDIVAAVVSTNSISVLMAAANGAFQPAQSFGTGASPVSVAVGDFNEDPYLDVATVNADTVSVLLGNGDGTFQAAVNTNLGSTGDSVAVGDFDNDGNLDLGVTSNYYHPGYWGWYYWYPGYYTGRANVLLGTGVGTFDTPSTIDLGYGYRQSAAVAYVNADANLDFVLTNPDASQVIVIQGVGDGTLGAVTSFYTGYYPLDVAAEDVNDDGHVDLLTADYYGDTISVLTGDGLGAFSAPQSFSAGSRPLSLALADFNGDNHTDVVATNVDAGSVSVLLGTGLGTFTYPVTATVGTYPLDAAVGDFNDDNALDVASINYTTADVSELLNNSIWPALDAPALAVSDVTVSEGNLATATAEFTVTLSAQYNQTVTVEVTTFDVSATLADDDYQTKTETLTFVSGQTSQSISVLVNGDRNAEGSEFFGVRLSNPSNAFIADPTGSGTILDDEPVVRIDYGPIVVNEGHAGPTGAVFTIRMDAEYDVPVTVDLSTFEGDTDFPYWGYYGYYYGPPEATSDVDFEAQSLVVTIDPGDTEKTVTINVVGDRDGEPDEYYSVNISNVNYGSIVASHAVGAILNDEPSVSIESASVTEADSGATTLNFNVTLSAAATAPVTVDFTTSDGSATIDGGDYQTNAGTLTFAIGESSKSISVQVKGDRLAEYDEYFLVNLTASSGAVLLYPTAYGTIVDNEPRISINSVSVTEGNRGSKLMTFTVSLSTTYDQTVTVKYATFNDSAVAGSDYVATSGTLTFSAQQKTKTFTVTIKGDKQKEQDEWFYVLLSDPSSNAGIDNAYGWGTIVNDEPGKGGRR